MPLPSRQITHLTSREEPGSCSPRHLLQVLWANRGLLFALTIQDLRSRYAGSILGLAWMMVIPFVQLTMYTLVFGYIYRVGQNEGLMQYALNLFCGFVPFIVVSESLGSAPSRIIGQPNYVKKVVFPLEILPLIPLCVSVLHALGALIILLVAVVTVGQGLHGTLMWLPFLLLVLLMQLMGMSWILSALGVFIRDLSSVIQLAIQFLFFLTPITYPLSFVPESFQALYRINPLVGIVESFRQVILTGKAPGLLDLLYATGFGLALITFGFYFFQRCRRGFADVV